MNRIANKTARLEASRQREEEARRLGEEARKQRELDEILLDLEEQDDEIDQVNDGNVSVMINRLYNEEESVNAVLLAPTQSGKTSAIFSATSEFISQGVSVIISVANNTCQIEQLEDRLEKYLSPLNCPKIFRAGIHDSKILRAARKNEQFILLCMDNSTQVKRLAKIISKAKEYIDELALIHDEADIITKHKNVSEVTQGQAVSHQQWVRFFKETQTEEIKLNRVFVSATPENCLMLYKVKATNVLSLVTPASYRGYNDMIFTESKTTIEHFKNMQEQVKRIKTEGTSEIILYTAERTIQNQLVTMNKLSKVLECVVNTYNGDGINVKFTSKEESDDFEQKMKGERYKILGENTYECNIQIADFYTILKDIGVKCVVTIGKNLMARGISFVSKHEDGPLAATVMMYSATKTTHAVCISQALGRVCGRARPEYKRYIFTDSTTWKVYSDYIRDQELYNKQFLVPSNNETLTTDIIDATPLIGIKNLDRKNLGLSFKTTLPPKYTESASGFDGEKVIKWITEKKLVGRMIEYLHSQTREISFEEFKDGLGYEKSMEDFMSNTRNGRSMNTQYGNLWIVKNNKISLVPSLKTYLDAYKY
jgi:hypothetical protein